MTPEQIDTIIEASMQLREMAYTLFEHYTSESTTNRSDWSYDEKCKYGSSVAVEHADKLDAIVAEYEQWEGHSK